MYLNNPKIQYPANSNLNQEECKVKEAKDEESPIWSTTPTVVYISIYCPHPRLLYLSDSFY